MTTHTAIDSGLSQCALALECLQKADGQWVSLLDLTAATGSLAIHSRIADLRKRGHHIEQRNTWKNRKWHSSYRLITPSA